VRGGGASRGGQRHLDVDLPLVLEVDVVDESQVVDVDRDLRVVALPQDADHVFLGRHVLAFARSYAGRRLLTFRLGRERLPPGEASTSSRRSRSRASFGSSRRKISSS